MCIYIPVSYKNWITNLLKPNASTTKPIDRLLELKLVPSVAAGILMILLPGQMHLGTNFILCFKELN